MLVDGGVPRMPARAFAALLATDTGRLTAAELAEALQVSPAAVSGAVRYLTQTQPGRRATREPGSRRDVYRLGDDLWYEAIYPPRAAARAAGSARSRTASRPSAPTHPPARACSDSAEFFAFLAAGAAGAVGALAQQRLLRTLIWHPARAVNVSPGGSDD